MLGFSGPGVVKQCNISESELQFSQFCCLSAVFNGKLVWYTVFRLGD